LRREKSADRREKAQELFNRALKREMETSKRKELKDGDGRKRRGHQVGLC